MPTALVHYDLFAGLRLMDTVSCRRTQNLIWVRMRRPSPILGRQASAGAWRDVYSLLPLRIVHSARKTVPIRDLLRPRWAKSVHVGDHVIAPTFAINRDSCSNSTPRWPLFGRMLRYRVTQAALGMTNRAYSAFQFL